MLTFYPFLALNLNLRKCYEIHLCGELMRMGVNFAARLQVIEIGSLQQHPNQRHPNQRLREN